MVIVDSSVWIDYLDNVETPHTAWLETELDRQRLGLTDLTLCEVLQGVRGEATVFQVQRQLMKYVVADTGGAAIAIASARNYRALRAKGITIRKTIDCIIATYCIERDHLLLHNDRDFDPFERHLGLRIQHP